MLDSKTVAPKPMFNSNSPVNKTDRDLEQGAETGAKLFVTVLKVGIPGLEQVILQELQKPNKLPKDEIPGLSEGSTHA